MAFRTSNDSLFPRSGADLLAGFERLILVEAKPPVSFFGYPGMRSTLAPPDCDFDILASDAQDAPPRSNGWRTRSARRPSPETCPRATALPAGEPLTAATIGRTVAALMPEDAIISDESISCNEQIWPHLAGAPRMIICR